MRATDGSERSRGSEALPCIEFQEGGDRQVRSVLNLKGRKSVWQWMREVDPWNALFLLGALGRTQSMLDSGHYLREYDLVAPHESVAAAWRAASALATFFKNITSAWCRGDFQNPAIVDERLPFVAVFDVAIFANTGRSVVGRVRVVTLPLTIGS